MLISTKRSFRYCYKDLGGLIVQGNFEVIWSSALYCWGEAQAVDKKMKA